MNDTMNQMRSRTLGGGLLAAITLAACASTIGPEDGSQVDLVVGDAAPIVHLEQGWTVAERDSFYYDSVGSRWLPYSWLLFLEQTTSAELFRTKDNMARFGAYTGDPSARNPDRLPIGFARVDVGGEAWVGPNCASCHVSELTYQGKTIHVDGGAGLADQYKLVKEIASALMATANDPAKLARFSHAVAKRDGSDVDGAQGRGALAQRMTEIAKTISANAEGMGEGAGPGRDDSFQFIANQVNCVAFGVPENCLPSTGAYLRFASIWGINKLEWNHHNSSAHNPLARSFLAMSGYPFGKIDSTTVDLNLNLTGLHDVISLLDKLKQPAWPEQVFGAIDRSKAKAGEKVYAAKCASCHSLAPYEMTAPNAFGASFVKSVTVPLDLTGTQPSSASNIGTDPTTVVTMLTQRMNPGPLGPFLPPELVGPDGSAQTLTILGALITQTFTESLRKLQMSPAETVAFIGMREDRIATQELLTSLRARLTEGFEWKGSYLHNGSVGSLYEMLLPEAERSKTIYVGDHEFDPATLGYRSNPKHPDAFTLDTSKPGNSNRGHSGPDYGTDMTDAERFAVIEYLKTK